MSGIGFGMDVDVKGPFFTQWRDALATMFEDSLEEAVKLGAEMVRDRAPDETGDFKRSIVGEVRTSRRGNRYGQVKSKVRERRRRWLERGERNGVKAWRGHKMFLRGKQELRKREKAIAEANAGKMLRKIR